MVYCAFLSIFRSLELFQKFASWRLSSTTASYFDSLSSPNPNNYMNGYTPPSPPPPVDTSSSSSLSPPLPSISSPPPASAPVFDLLENGATERGFQLEEMEDKESCTTELVLRADSTVVVGETNGPPCVSATGTWKVVPDTAFGTTNSPGTLQVELQRVYDAGREKQAGTDMGQFTFTVQRRLVGPIQRIGSSLLMIEGSIHDLDDSFTDRSLGYFSMIDNVEPTEDQDDDPVAFSSVATVAAVPAPPQPPQLLEPPSSSYYQPPPPPPPQYQDPSPPQYHAEPPPPQYQEPPPPPPPSQGGGGDRPWNQSWIRR